MASVEADTDRPPPPPDSGKRGLLGRVALGAAIAGLTLLIRATLASYIPGVPPYALSFPAVLLATLVCGQWGGLAGLIVCQLGAWYFFLTPHFIFAFADLSAAVSFVIATASAAMVWWTSVLYRRERSRALASEGDRLAERERALSVLLRRFDNAHSFMALWRGPDHRFDYVNQAYLDLIGETPAIVGKTLLDARPHAEPLFVQLLNQVRETGQSTRIRERESVIVRGDGSRTVRFLDFVYEPVVGETGAIEGVFLEGRDVTETVQNRRAIDESERRMRLAVQASEIGVWEWRLDTNEMIYSDQAKRICGFPTEEPVSFEMVVGATHPEDYPITSAQAARMRDPAIREQAPFEYRIVRPSGEVRWVEAHGEMVFETVDGEERATVFLGTLIDVTERKAAEERLRLLAHEVDHRSNNLLTLVMGAIERSSGGSEAVLKATILGRVQALARSHQLLTASRWTGASLMKLLQDELAPFALGEEERVVIRGEDGSLAPQVAQGLAMCIHELVTNAAKYGALKSPEGRVRVQVRRVDESLCRVVWTETGGPAVTAPTREGFGTAVLARSLHACGGEVKLDWRPEGLVCELLAPTVG